MLDQKDKRENKLEQDRHEQDRIDEGSEESFPASDPPSYSQPYKTPTEKKHEEDKK